jgi:chitodextrinase
MPDQSPQLRSAPMRQHSVPTIFGNALILLGIVFYLQTGILLCAATPAFIQEKDHQITSGRTNQVAFSSSVGTSSLIVVFLIWDNNGGASVSDSVGNTYFSALPPTRWSNNSYSVQTFYAINTKGGADMVTATYTSPVTSFGIVYAHEYSGVLQIAPVDVTAAASGSSGSLNSGFVTTTNAVDLLFAGGVSATTVSSPGSGYTARSTAQGNITEDRTVSAIKSYSATASNRQGAWAMQMVAFKAASGTGSAPPTAPTGLSVTGTTTTTTSLSWKASTDNIGVAGYKIYRTGAQVGTATTTSYTDTGLTASTAYSYTVAAYDAAGNTSAQSSAVQATTQPDTTAPTAPAGLSITASTASTISLSWNASTDNVGVAGYKIFRAGVQVGTSTVTSYNDTGLAASTAYSYTVSAYDAAGNISAHSTALQATTSAQTDTTPPTVPTGLSVTGTTVNTASLSWTASTDNVGVAGYKIFRAGVQVGTSSVTSYTDAGLTASTTYSYAVAAYDAAGNTSTQTTPVSATTASASSGSYNTTFLLAENPISEGGNWTNGGAIGLDWTDVQTTPHFAFGTMPGEASGGAQYADSTAVLNGAWGPDQTVQATVSVTNASASSSVFEEVELRLHTTITAHSITGYEINCSVSTASGHNYVQIVRWNGPLASFTLLDARANGPCVNGDILKATINGSTITVYLNGNSLFSVIDSTYGTGNPGIGFFLQGTTGVNANYGFSQFSASDGSTLDTTPPSTPANLAGVVVSSSQIDLNWTASTGNVAVAGYRVFRNGTQIASTTAPAYSDTPVVPGTQYTYAVAAFYSAGNVSPLSAPVTIATSSASDTTPPSVPSDLKATKVTSTSLTLSWTASTDNVAVGGYQIFRDGAQVGTATTTSYLDTGLIPSTSYVYTVAAYDTSNNVSSPSQQLAVTTTSGAVTPPSFVQVNNNQISSGGSTSVTLNAPTVAGNTIVVYLIWNNTGSAAVSDSRGDTFVSVGSPVSWGNGYSAQVLYANGIVGGTDTVTATFRTSVTSFGVLYVHEYAGISTSNPVDLTASASGSSGSLNSGTATTTSANDLIFGAGVSDNVVTAAGLGFTSRDMAYGNITEDKVAGSTGSYSATATQGGNMWGMQMVAFRAAH